jgi:hypothetical protein
MKEEKRALLIKYIVCFSVASLITFIVFTLQGSFTDRIGVNIQILSDSFFVSGILFLFIAGMMFVSGEGALIGISFVLRNIAQAFVPMGRKNHEFYKDYRARKLAEKKQSANDHAILVTGLVFLIISVVFTLIWYFNFYNVV